MEIIGVTLINQYKHGEINTFTFCDKYLDLYAEDGTEQEVESGFSNILFGLCVNYLDPTENKAEVEEEIHRHIAPI